MLEIALQSLPNIEIDDRELKRNKPSYTFDTLSELAATYPRHHLCFIIGMDSMLAFDTWYRWQDILQLSSLVVMKRGGYQAHFNKTLAPFIKKNEVNTAKELYQGETGKILFVETPTVAISSTDIRKNIAKHQSNKGLLPTEVIHYIEQHGLYL